MTDQELYNTVKTHLLAQNAKSVDSENGNCKYRNPVGLKCAAGCLISDEDYDPNMEGIKIIHDFQRDQMMMTPDKQVAWKLLRVALKGVEDRQLHLLRDLQFIHDENSVADWKDDLEALALCRGLEP